MIPRWCFQNSIISESDAELDMRAHVEAYGCTLNFGEAKEIEELLSSRGWDIVANPAEADLNVIATCVVVAKTEKAMMARLGELKDSRRLVVTGCMATTCKEKVEALAPKAKFVPPGDLEEFSRLVEGVGGRKSAAGADSTVSYGIVPIATGCLGSCSYCITKLARGVLRSRPPERILDSVRNLVRAGPRELRITAQDTAAYGTDIGSSLPSLVESMCSLPGDFKVRIGMMNPRSALLIKDKLAAMYELPKVFKFVHLPVQSASDSLLERMARGYTCSGFRSIVAGLREKVPELSLSTDLIVGYPGETDEDHASNLQLITDLRPDIVNVTRFSPRPNTEAAREDGVVPGALAKERSREITERRFEVALAVNQAWVGREVLAFSTERGKKRSTLLRTDEYRQIVIPDELPLGRRFKVEIDGATTTYLRGRRIDGS